LRQALLQNNGRYSLAQATHQGPGAISAAMAAENSLKQRRDLKHNSFGPKPIEIALPFQVSHVSRLAKLQQWLRRRATVLVAITLGSAVVLGFEWYLLPFEVETFVVDQMGDAVEAPIKTFEGGAESVK